MGELQYLKINFGKAEFCTVAQIFVSEKKIFTRFNVCKTKKLHLPDPCVYLNYYVLNLSWISIHNGRGQPPLQNMFLQIQSDNSVCLCVYWVCFL